MAGRNRAFDEEIVLQKATEVFWTKGYESASTDELLAAMNLNKGSLYNAFGSKKQLFKTVVTRYAAAAFENLRNDIRMSSSPTEVIRKFFNEACDSEELSAHLKGCFLGNAVSELANIDGELEQLAIEKLITLEQIFKEALDKAQSATPQPLHTNTKITARYLITLWNGINVTRRMYPRSAELEPLLKMSLSLLP